MFERIDRVISLTDDFEGARHFFADVMGWQFDTEVASEEHGMRVVHSGRRGLELAAPMHDRSPLAALESDWLKRHGPGLRWVVIKVTDMDAALAHCKAKGIVPVSLATIGSAKEAFLDPRDTYGVPIILNEFADPHPMTQEGLSMLG